MPPPAKRTLFPIRLPAPAAGLRTELPGFEGVRFGVEEAEDSLVAAADRLALPRSALSDEPFNILAISGGAAGGAFGAGVLVGLTQAGARPKFAIVTGVSTGALMAPFAFLGSAWDDRLTEAYTGGYAVQALSLKHRPDSFGVGLLGARALERLIDRFIDQDVVEAVAREHALGRRLLTMTTDLDRQATCIWDMGQIASHGGPEALALFRKVLVASSSLPGLFPPRRFACEADGVAYEEMHVDGGVSAPLFIMPEALLRWRNLGNRLDHGRIYVIVNTVLEQAPRTTHNNIASILFRSFDTMLRFSYRNALSTAATFCAAHNLPLSATALLDDPANGNMLNFDTANMKRVFDAAVTRAQGDHLWTTPPPDLPPPAL
ncbi:MAG: patatin-like phospholipase family protein [Alphaproteobacteria bacterium]|nr:patatin-like phospholipase family protein [Alphaproteobacteria bacterium]MBU1514823.1 patatin-like phospholipase family protein [Alphaproteobacteria bacterium]MBU2093954.1 patatin-like phospholipase family protein [Alphaproteobacteria bacterium]MBU2153381.1 patatin-like phospholipase family protein [Alphaproteobacteria bacterium]MBU2309809.1 patatin-like phospholipase family protein [Alphaproteobacteria bacterium]